MASENNLSKEKKIFSTVGFTSEKHCRNNTFPQLLLLASENNPSKLKYFPKLENPRKTHGKKPQRIPQGLFVFLGKTAVFRSARSPEFPPYIIRRSILSLWLSPSHTLSLDPCQRLVAPQNPSSLVPSAKQPSHLGRGLASTRQTHDARTNTPQALH